LGIIAVHTLVNPMEITSSINNIGIRPYNWSEIGYGINTKFKIKNIIFSTNVLNIDSKNYAWTINRNKSNIFLQLNTTYLW